MDTPLSNPASPLLVYGIREMVDVAHKLKQLDPSLNLVWENIGDPVNKGWPVPPFLKEILIDEINKQSNAVFAYTHSRGALSAREWAAAYSKRFCSSSKLTAEDVLFTNGLGSAIAMVYQMLKPGSRILQPTPTYPTHASFESFSAGEPPLLYELDPYKSWEPNLKNIEEQITKHPEIAGITIINPNNPTGAVYSRETLNKFVALAEKYKLMIISDEIYFRLVYPGLVHEQITELAAGRVPLIVMRGLSKDVPWPGGRCGWLEFHNTDLNPDFKKYVESVKQRVLLEVCAGTLPQTILPALYGHPKFDGWNSDYCRALADTAAAAALELRAVPELIVNQTAGAFYLMAIFKSGALNNKQTLPIKNDSVRKWVEQEAGRPNIAPDKRFAYYLLATTGIVVVPATDFFSPHYGFRVTTLERDPLKRKKTYGALINAIKNYLKSA